MPTPSGRPIVKSFSCSCGFTREWNDDERGDHVIDHPIWGTVTSREAAFQDIKWHDCAEYAAAVARARAIFGPRRNYPPHLSEDRTSMVAGDL